MIHDSYDLTGLMPEEFLARLEDLNLRPVILHGGGVVSMDENISPLEKIIVSSQMFTQKLIASEAEILQKQSMVRQLIEGVWLITFNSQMTRKPINKGELFPRRIPAIVLINRTALNGPQMMGLVKQAGENIGALLSDFERSSAYTDNEIARLSQSLSWMSLDTTKLERYVQEIQSVSKQLGETYEELSLLYKLTTSMKVNQPPQAFLEEALEDLQVVVGVKWFSLKLTEEDCRLAELAGKAINAGPVPNGIDVLDLFTKVHDAKSSDQYASVIVDDTKTYGVSELEQYAQHLLFIPLICDGKCVAVLCGGDKHDGSEINSVDYKLCNALSNSLSIFIENVMLYADMQAMFMGTLHSLTASIDAKDSYTRGHSERVAYMAKQLAIAAKLDEKTVERVYISGLVHDVGKIGVPEMVLTKPGKLTDEEYEMIKKHPEIGAQIIEDIPRMQDLIPGVLYHHERYDGRGYPYRLAGEKIPLFGRLICLADAFDAMSSTRSYREKLDHNYVLNEISKCAGAQFDLELAAMFVKLDFSEYFKMIASHKSGSGFSQAA